MNEYIHIQISLLYHTFEKKKKSILNKTNNQFPAKPHHPPPPTEKNNCAPSLFMPKSLIHYPSLPSSCHPPPLPPPNSCASYIFTLLLSELNIPLPHHHRTDILTHPLYPSLPTINPSSTPCPPPRPGKTELMILNTIS